MLSALKRLICSHYQSVAKHSVTAHAEVLKDNTEQPECFSQYQTLFFPLSPEILHQLLLHQSIKNVAKAMPEPVPPLAAARPGLGLHILGFHESSRGVMGFLASAALFQLGGVVGLVLGWGLVGVFTHFGKGSDQA